MIAVIIFATLWLIASVWIVISLHSRISALEKGRTVPIPKLVKEPQCAKCQGPVGPLATEVSMTIQLANNITLPVTLKICDKCLANA